MPMEIVELWRHVAGRGVQHPVEPLVEAATDGGAHVIRVDRCLQFTEQGGTEDSNLRKEPPR